MPSIPLLSALPRRAGHRLIGLCAFGLLALASSVQAEKIEPPFEALYSPMHMLVAGKVDEINPVGRVVFEFGERLSGKQEAPELIDVRVPSATLAKVHPGERYLFAYQTFTEDVRHPGRLMLNPAGLIMLVSTGLEPALFADTPATRELLGLGKSEHGRESRGTLDRLLATLGDADPQLQNLAAAQIALEPKLYRRLKPADLAPIEALVRDPGASIAARTVLLEAASQHPDRFGATWWADAARAIVTTTPVRGQAPDSGWDELVRTAFGVLAEQPGKLPTEALTRWIEGESPTLAEMALLTLRRQASELERPAIQQALAEPQLPAATREFLQDHLRRLDLAAPASAGKKPGAH